MGKANLPVTGLIHVTGEPDTGKTTLALTVPGVSPSEYVFFDDDKKTQSIADALQKAGTPFGYYVNLVRESSEKEAFKPLKYYELIDKFVEEAKKKVPNAKVLVWDNFDRTEEAIRAYSMTIMENLTDMTPNQIRAMTQVTWNGTYKVYGEFLDRLAQIAPLVIIVTHTREKYLGNQKTGMLESRGQKPLIEKTNLRIGQDIIQIVLRLLD